MRVSGFMFTHGWIWKKYSKNWRSLWLSLPGLQGFRWPGPVSLTPTGTHTWYILLGLFMWALCLGPTSLLSTALPSPPPLAVFLQWFTVLKMQTGDIIVIVSGLWCQGLGLLTMILSASFWSRALILVISLSLGSHLFSFSFHENPLNCFLTVLFCAKPRGIRKIKGKVGSSMEQRCCFSFTHSISMYWAPTIC